MTTEGWVVFLWSTTLIVALVLTLVALPILNQILRSASEIDRLLKETVPSADNIVTNTAAIKELEIVVAGAGPLLAASSAIRTVGSSISRHTRTVAAALGAGS